MTPSPELALHRFGLGARPGEIARIGDPMAWLEGQLTVQPEPDSFKAFPTGGEIVRDMPAPEDIAMDKRGYEKEVRAAAQDAVTARMMAAFSTTTPFHERLVWFWSNHLSITMTAKLRIMPFAFDYERSAIRPNVTGRFADLLLASARHPAMGFYLDNAISIGPNSVAGQKRSRGLNENYARELMELHTLGVGSGYSQADIQALASILTGWTVAPPNRTKGDDAFLFVANRHEPGPKTLLGGTYQEGEAEGIRAITFLARHPATARRIATKFAAHFTADQPDGALVAHLEKVFVETDGDLGAMTRALIRHEAAWRPALEKARDPLQFVTAAIRATGGDGPDALPPPAQKKLGASLATLGQKTFEAPSPQGWPDDTSSWFGPDQVLERVEWALALAGQAMQDTDPAGLAADLLGSLLSETTKTAIARAPSPQDGLAMLLASPEFMRR